VPKGRGTHRDAAIRSVSEKNINAGKKVPEQCVPKVETGHVQKYDLKIGW
jgi:hypothetical protein